MIKQRLLDGVLIRQLLKFGIVGVASNLLMFVIYLYLTVWNVPPMLAMSLVYVTAVLITFSTNLSWTFRYRGQDRSRAFRKYCLMYVCGYLLNVLLLHYLVSHLRLPHEYVQGGVILLLAVLSFLTSRHWVFDSKK